MKNFYVALIFFLISFIASAQEPFITTWEVTNESLEITIPVPSSEYSYDYTIDFGDGTTMTNVASSITHTYSSAGIYTVEISGVFPAIRIYDSDYENQIKLKSIEQWGDVAWQTMYRAFMRSYNLVINATDAPDLSQVTDMSYMFVHAESLNQSINHWDVSNVEDMSWMFESALVFNQPLDNWNVSNVTNMFRMFYGAVSFNQPIGNWDVSNVTSFGFMFSRDVNVPSTYPGLIFNQPLNSWNTSNAINMDGMFYGAEAFNQPLDSWNVSSVTTMVSMFNGATQFNQPLNNWDVSNVTNMAGMFSGATAFNQPLNSWNTSSLNTISSMFSGASAFNQPIDSWDVSGVDDMNYVFYNASSFNGTINAWNVSNVVTMSSMFYGASNFNQPLNNWNTSNVQSMSEIFKNASNFNQPLDNWDVSNVEWFDEMFMNATSFNGAVNGWDFSSIDNQGFFGDGVADMFNGAIHFNQPVDQWNISNLISLAWLFRGASAFNQPLDNWDVSNIKKMTSMFEDASAFNQPLNSWDVSNVDYVQSMTSMFEGASSFNQPLDNWNVSNVSWMNNMFKDASSFNQDLSSWDVSYVDRFNNMFENASSYNQPLNSWDFSDMDTSISIYGLYKFLSHTNMSIENYDAFLQHLTTYDFSAILGAEGLQYCDETSVDYLENQLNWDIYGHSPALCNMVSGTVYFDSNNNECDASDVEVSNYFVFLENTENQNLYATQIMNGNYELALSGNSFTASVQGLPDFMTASPIDVSVEFLEESMSETLDFCLTASQTIEDLSVTIVPISEARPGFESTYQLIVENIGTESISNIEVNLEFDDTMQSFVSSIPTPNTTTTDNLQFSFSSLNPFETKVVDIKMQVLTPPIVNSDDLLTFNASVLPSTNDYSPENNTYQLEQIVVNSYDPNDINVLQGESITVSQTSEYLDYVIRFQNTGTASAVNVEVQSLLHNNLDPSSFRMLNSSHDYTVKIENNIITFTFENIHLPDETSDSVGSNGFIAYRLKPKSNIQVGEVMDGIAAIYFDFNEPIITNMVSTTVVENLGIDEYESNLVSIYPNPFNNVIYLNSKNGIEVNVIEIIDLQGKVLIKSSNETDKIKTDQLSSGVYILSLETNSGILNSRIIKN
ncbi:BspA family leucine-rich repeat surface protein [Winogradskyella marincola]|uniref:BspA family leucine-rich repeat surface protein n=1 Tax=Winogradskyella marincola TaxID=3037795 RepID=A0ABT6G057_9FLAO|nr:BspA family leucine-rich repeat surface protein [Winogradskyella sp. YYF002]MDG4715421.1 BspA family leucine-rich repeat surface protein [Winogradskyella sp. YYF002]